MAIKSSPGLRRCIAAILLSLGAVASAGAESGQALPDLLALPAQADVRAQRSLQLAVTRAGERLVSVGVRGVVLLSDDEGRQWRQARAVPTSVALTDVSFGSAREGWVVGHSGVVLFSDDGGETWQRQLDGRQAAEIVLEEALARQAAGDPAAARAVRDAQRMVEEGPDKPFLSVRFEGQRGIVVGAYGLALATDDGGRNWRSLVGRIPNPRGKHLYQVRVDGREILIAGEQGALFRSQDGGESFIELKTPYGGTFFGVIGIDSDRLLAFGLRGNVWRSTDGGAKWQRIDVGQEVTLTAGQRLADGSIVLIDESGRVLRSRDSGASFAVLPAGAATGLTALVEARDGALILSGARGVARVESSQLVAEIKP